MNCKNCKRKIIEDSDYCNYCGARVVRNRLTIANLLSHFSEEFLNYDNRFLQTFKNLFLKPEDVIRSYIEGTRKKYVNVISYFAIAITISGIQLFVLQRFFPESLNFNSISQPGLEEFNKGVFNFMREYQSIAMMLNVPIYALISRIVFIKERHFKYNYTEHLVIFMYLLAQLSMINVILMIIGAMFGFAIGEMSLLFAPLQLLFSGYCLKRIFNLNWPDFILRSLIFFGVLVVLIIIFSIVFAVIAKQTGLFDTLLEAQRQAIEASKNGK